MKLQFLQAAAAAASAEDLNRIPLEIWDWLVIALFFVAMIWIIVDVSKKKKNTSGDYFLSGRNAT